MRGQLVDLLAEFGRVGVERDQLVDEGVDLLLERGLLLVLERHQAGRLLGLTFCSGCRRLERQASRRRSRSRSRSGWPWLVPVRMRSRARLGLGGPSARDKVYYLHKSPPPAAAQGWIASGSAWRRIGRAREADRPDGGLGPAGKKSRVGRDARPGRQGRKAGSAGIRSRVSRVRVAARKGRDCGQQWSSSQRGLDC